MNPGQPEPPLAHWPASLRRALWMLWSLFWLLMIAVAVQDNLDDDSVRWWQPLMWEGSSAFIGTGLMLLQLWYGRRQQHLLNQPWRWFWQHLKWLPIASTVFIALAYSLRHLVYAALGATYTHPPLWQIWPYETIKLGLFMGLWLGVLFGVHSFLAWRDQQTRLHALQQALTDAKLQQLKAQLQPHFLFNTLNTISSFMHSDVDRADRLLIKLADLLRASLTLGEQNTVPLREELQLATLYTEIMTERFGPRGVLNWQIANDCLDLHVPALLLQPLLENAFKHAVERSREPVTISVMAKRVSAAGGDHELALTIENSVPATTANTPASTGIGLRNCRERLQALYGERAVMQIEQTANHHRVRLTLPIPP